MAAYTRVGIKEFYIGASTDTKPTTAPPGSKAYEHNTGAQYIMQPDMATWTVYAPTKYVPDGLVTAPGLAFASDPDTGIYRVGANTIGVAAGGAQAMNFTTFSGRPAIGIGTPGVEWAGLLTEISRTNIGVSVPVGAEAHYKLAVTDAPWQYNFSASNGTATVLATNTQNWTKTTPSIAGLWGTVMAEAGATGTISWAAGLSTYFGDVRNINGVTVTNFCNMFAGDPQDAGAGTGAITNLYGLYIKALTSGVTSNWAVYAPSNAAYFAGLTVAGDLLFGANKIKSTSLYLYEVDANTFGIKDIAGNTYQNLTLNALRPIYIDFIQGNGTVILDNADSSSVTFRARRQGTSLADIAYIVSGANGGADAYWQFLTGIKTPQSATASPMAVLTTAASANLKNSDNTEKSTVATDYTKIKQILLNEAMSGTVRITFDLKTAGGGATATARVYKNGVALGTEQTDVTGGYVTKTEDLGPFVAGDLIQIYAKTSDGAQAAYVQNFRLLYDVAIVTTALSVTNQDP